jgi:hypothetical protein
MDPGVRRDDGAGWVSWFGSGLILVWFWFGSGLVQQKKSAPVGALSIQFHVPGRSVSVGIL